MVKTAVKICCAILFLLWLFCFPREANAQEMPDSLTQAVLITADSAANAVTIPEIPKTAFKPNPTKSVLFALIPGMGQIYNRKYWKLPLVYGGLMGCMYAITWNNKMYKDYLGIYESNMQDAYAYQKVLDSGDEEAIANFQFNPKWASLRGIENAATDVFNTRYQDGYKSRKNYFRRYRDLSIIIGIGVYALSIIDAYVDAQLFDFDISPDLTMRVEPVYSPQTQYGSRTVGVNWSLTF